MQVFLCLLCGLLAGVLGGMFGVGGGIIIVPFLAIVLGFTQQKAQGTSLVALLAPVGIFALINYWKEGKADLWLGALIGLGFMVGAIFGSKIALAMSGDTLKKAFGVFMIVVGIYTVFNKEIQSLFVRQ